MEYELDLSNHVEDELDFSNHVEDELDLSNHMEDELDLSKHVEDDLDRSNYVEDELDLLSHELRLLKYERFVLFFAKDYESLQTKEIKIVKLERFHPHPKSTAWVMNKRLFLFTKSFFLFSIVNW